MRILLWFWYWVLTGQKSLDQIRCEEEAEREYQAERRRQRDRRTG